MFWNFEGKVWGFPDLRSWRPGTESESGQIRIRCWQECQQGCWHQRGCWQRCAGKGTSFIGKVDEQHLCQHSSASTPFVASTLASSPASTFPDFGQIQILRPVIQILRPVIPFLDFYLFLNSFAKDNPPNLPRISSSAQRCNGQIVGQPRKRECRQNVRKCRKNVRKMSKNCPEGLKTQFSDIFRTFFAYLVDAFVWRPCPMLARCKPNA